MRSLQVGRRLEVCAAIGNLSLGARAECPNAEANLVSSQLRIRDARADAGAACLEICHNYTPYERSIYVSHERPSPAL